MGYTAKLEYNTKRQTEFPKADLLVKFFLPTRQEASIAIRMFGGDFSGFLKIDLATFIPHIFVKLEANFAEFVEAQRGISPDLTELGQRIYTEFIINSQTSK